MSSTEAENQETNSTMIKAHDGGNESSIPVIQNINIRDLRRFSNHPYKVEDNEANQGLSESISEIGISEPLIVREDNSGHYEILAGHRRAHCAQKAGLEEVPAIIKKLNDEEATAEMLDSNLQRSNLLPSEMANVYKIRMDLIRKKAGRPKKNTPRQNVGDSEEAANKVGEMYGISGREVQRYLHLNNLIPPLLDMVDKKRIPKTAAANISGLEKDAQESIHEFLEKHNDQKLSLAQSSELKRRNETEGSLSKKDIFSILEEKQGRKTIATEIKFTEAELKKYFPLDYTSDAMRNVITDLLTEWKKGQVKDAPQGN